MADDVTHVLEQVHRDEWARLLATVTGQVGGDIALAEDAVQEAFAQAARQWPTDGVPDRPAGWLTVTARRRAIDLVRRDATRSRYHEALARMEEVVEDDNGSSGIDEDDDDRSTRGVPDDRLRMIFTCCHPSLAIESRLALTLRTLGGLEVPEIARAFLVSEATMFQRITPCEAQAAGRQGRVQGSGNAGSARTTGRRASSDLPDLHRGTLGIEWDRPRSRRLVR